MFFRQIRNFVIDMTSIPATSSATGIHWPTAQATSIQNVIFQMSSASGTQHTGIFIESGKLDFDFFDSAKGRRIVLIINHSGSGGFITDLTFNGGLMGLDVGSQQFTIRHITFNNVVTAINQIWDWGWLYHGLSINNCGTGINIASGGSSAQSVGSVTLIDSSIVNTPVGIVTAYSSSSSPTTAGSLIIENVALSNVPVAIRGPSGTVLAGTTGSTTISAWGEGNKYTPNGPTRFQGPFTANSRPSTLLSGSVYYSRSKPQYNALPTSSFLSVRSAGATGNGVTDDTAALQSVINAAASAGKVVYFDSGTYKVTSTLTIPPGSKLVGEVYPIIMSSGSYFNDMNNPRPVVRVGTTGQTGQVEWSDMVVSTQGAQGGAILIEWNLATSGTPSGMWDVHTRIGGFAGSALQVSNCPMSGSTSCIAAYMSMHVTAGASGLYMENTWLWTADHDIDSSDNTQITVYAGRGLYIESTAGTFWLYVFAFDLFLADANTIRIAVMGQRSSTTPFTSII